MHVLPFVSIVVAAYNSEKTIGKCIETLLALNYPSYEVIVVDNNSSDNTADIIRQYNVKYLYETKKGWPAARNLGISFSKAKYAANIDADCFPTTYWLRNLIAGFRTENIGCVVGQTLVEEGQTLAQRYYAAGNPFGIEHKIKTTQYVPWGGGNNVMLRDAFIKSGGYNSEKFKSGADMEFHLRLKKEFGYQTIYEPNALIYHEARGTSKEFFQTAAKYTHDGFLRSRIDEMKETQSYYRFFLMRKLYHIFLNILGVGYRAVKASINRDTWFRVVSNFFTIICLTGSIFGYAKARTKYLLQGKK